MQMNRHRKRKPGEAHPALYEHAIQQRLNMCGLTERQQEVAGLVIRGLSNREISERLSIEEYTVKVHVRDIFQRLEVHRRTALMAKILRLAPLCHSPISPSPNLVESVGSLTGSRAITSLA